MAMRSALPLAALLALSACGSFGQLRAGAPEPLAYDQFVPAGARVKAIVRGGGVVEGTLLSRFRREGPQIVICQAALCAGPASPHVRTVPVDSVQRLQVWGRKGGLVGMLGLYTGALGGALADGGDDGGTMLLGGLAGMGLGYVIGSRFEGWIVAIPCVHVCGGWQTERLPPAPAGAAPAPRPPPLQFGATEAGPTAAPELRPKRCDVPGELPSARRVPNHSREHDAGAVQWPINPGRRTDRAPRTMTRARAGATTLRVAPRSS